MGKDDLENWCNFCSIVFKLSLKEFIWALVSISQSSLNMPSVGYDISGIDGYEDSVLGKLMRFRKYWLKLAV